MEGDDPNPGSSIEMVDRITHLPEEILLHIFSFLPTTKHRAVTSLLSRRWRHLWTHVPSLEFHRNEYIDSPHYPALVNLCLHNSPTLHRLSAFLPPAHFSPRKKAHDLLHTWLSTAASRSVRELSLRFDTHRRGFRLPPSLLSCAPSLRVLKLHTCDLSHIPWGTCAFPCLETVVLQHIVMEEEQFHALLAKCPNLVDLQLHVRSSLMFSFTRITISSSVNPRLKNLGIRGFFSRVILDVSDLRFLSLALYTSGDLRVNEMPKLKEAEFLSMSRKGESLPLCLLEVEFLSTTAEFFKVRKGEDLTFANLKVLYGRRIPSTTSFDYFTSFLEHCPLLEKIYITLYYFIEDRVFNYELSVTPSTWKCPVKSITIVGFTGHVRSMLLLKYFLGVMPHLNHLHLIISEEEIPGISLEDFLEQVRQIPRVSRCVLDIVVETLSNFSPPSIGRCFDFD